jgi:hypothetical protein
VIFGVLLDLSPLGTALEISPCQVAQRLLGRGNEASSTSASKASRTLLGRCAPMPLRGASPELYVIACSPPGHRSHRACPWSCCRSPILWQSGR